MNPEQSKLRQQPAEQAQTTGEIQSTQAQGKDFATVDDLLRYDSEMHPVPPEVAKRLAGTLEAEPKPSQPWYKRLFG